MKKALIAILLIIQTILMFGQKVEIISLDTSYENSSIAEVIVIYKNFKKKGDLFQEITYQDKQGQLLFRTLKKECAKVEIGDQECEKIIQKLTKVGKKHGYQKTAIIKSLKNNKIKDKKRWRTEEYAKSSTRKIIDLNDTTIFWEVITIDYQIKRSPIEETYNKNKIVNVRIGRRQYGITRARASYQLPDVLNWCFGRVPPSI